MFDCVDDVYHPEKEGEPEPDWVAAEREEFSNDRDKDKDGKYASYYRNDSE